MGPPKNKAELIERVVALRGRTLGWIAERVAVAKAVEAGARSFVAIAIATATDPPATPCGVCRQVLREFNSELAVVCVNPSGDRRDLWLSDLLPHSFSKKDLDV